MGNSCSRGVAVVAYRYIHVDFQKDSLVVCLTDCCLLYFYNQCWHFHVYEPVDWTSYKPSFYLKCLCIVHIIQKGAILKCNKNRINLVMYSLQTPQFVILTVCLPCSGKAFFFYQMKAYFGYFHFQKVIKFFYKYLIKF